MRLAIPDIKEGDWQSVRIAFQKLVSLRLGSGASPIFASLTLSGLTATRLIQTDADKKLASVTDLTGWIAGTTNRVTVSDDADGTLTLSGPQDIHTGASPTFAGLTITNVINEFSTDGTLGGNSDSALPTEKAVKTYADAGVGAGGHDHDTDTLQLDGINSDGGAFSFTTSGNITFSQSLILEDTTSSTTGVIYKGANRFIHNFHHLTGESVVPEGWNTFVGEYAGNFTMGSTAISANHGSANTGMGYGVLYYNTRGYKNSAFGFKALHINSIGFDNFGQGYKALYSNTAGARNSAIGSHAILYNQIGNDITALGSHTGGYGGGAGNSFDRSTLIGSYSGYNITTGSDDLFFGYKSGYNQTTNSNLLIIDNQDRTSVTNELVNSLIYGVFDAASANQSLRVNGYLITKEAIKGLERSTDPAEPAEGEFVMWMSDGTEFGDDGDICIASQAGAATKKAILFDHSAGDVW